MRKRRVLSYRYKNGFTGVQVLQERRWWGWKTIDREVIPDYVIISLATFGDTGGWVSKFSEEIEKENK